MSHILDTPCPAEDARGPVYVRCYYQASPGFMDPWVVPDISLGVPRGGVVTPVMPTGVPFLDPWVVPDIPRTGLAGSLNGVQF